MRFIPAVSAVRIRAPPPTAIQDFQEIGSLFLSATDKWNIKYSGSYHVKIFVGFNIFYVKINRLCFHTFLDTAIFK